MRNLLVALAALLATSASAGETQWVELAPGVDIRLISSGVLTDEGVTYGGIEVRMPDTTKTYWKIPGETGIPTQMDIGGSAGIESHRTRWPYPTIDQKDGYTDFVYYGPTVFPVEMKVGSDAPVWTAEITMGICSDICVPAEARLSLALEFEKPDRGNVVRIRQALSLAPEPWRGEEEAIEEVIFDTKRQLLAVRLGSDDIDPGSVIADIGDTSLIFGAPQKSPDGELVLLPVLGGKGDAGLAGRSIQFTFLTEQGAYTASSPVASTAAAL